VLEYVRWKDEKMPSKDISLGHRKRLREKFIKSGLAGFHDYEIIELLLSLVLPHQEGRKLAKECLEHFKSLSGVLTASPQELERVGVTPVCTFCIKFLYELPMEVLKQKIIEQPFYKSSKEVFSYLYYTVVDSMDKSVSGIRPSISTCC